MEITETEKKEEEAIALFKSKISLKILATRTISTGKQKMGDFSLVSLRTPC